MDPDPDPGHFFTDLLNYFNKKYFSHFLFYFFAYFYSKTWRTIPKWGNFYNLSFLKSSNLAFRSKKVLFVIFDWYLIPWIRIQEAKILRIQRIRIRILSTALNDTILYEGSLKTTIIVSLRILNIFRLDPSLQWTARINPV